ncbi:hypothetical protein, partial [Vibrio crassostreae]|uniref:hypothetical protein n=1 Tax=Vibrio crassostreae TaxID=246167 RepID=UPI001B308B23
QVINRLSLVNKLDAGAKPDDVLAKELSLSGVQRPISPELLNSFTKWFQIGEFCGYLYEGYTAYICKQAIVFKMLCLLLDPPEIPSDSL